MKAEKDSEFELKKKKRANSAKNERKNSIKPY